MKNKSKVQLTHETLPLPKQSIFLNNPWICLLLCEIQNENIW